MITLTTQITMYLPLDGNIVLLLSHNSRSFTQRCIMQLIKKLSLGCTGTSLEAVLQLHPRLCIPKGMSDHAANPSLGISCYAVKLAVGGWWKKLKLPSETRLFTALHAPSLLALHPVTTLLLDLSQWALWCSEIAHHCSNSMRT